MDDVINKKVGVNGVRRCRAGLAGVRAALFERAPWQQVLGIMLAAIVYVHLFGAIGTTMLVSRVGWGKGILTDGTPADAVEGRFARWDSGYYLAIARNGYSPDGTERAFFPLYPLLIRLLGQVTGWSLLWSGLVASAICFVGAGWLLYRWVQMDADAQVARWSVIWLCAFPTAFFFSAVYAEALFLLTSIAAVYFAQRGRFIAGGFAIALAGATRPLAFLLAVPYLIEFLAQRDFRPSRCLAFGTGALIAPLGVLGYLSFLGYQAGETNLFAVYAANHAAEWKRAIHWPWVTLYNGIRAAVWGVNIVPDWFSRANVWQDLISALLAFVIAIWALFRLRPSAAAFLFASVVVLFANHGPAGYAFYSAPRYIAAMFPIYPALALLTLRLPRQYRWLPVAASAAAMGFLAAWFASGRWVA